MRILHTSDWHLGRMLENKTRYAEQKHFIDEIGEIAEREKAEIILISGDVYDTSNPSAAAEEMFYNSAVKLAGEGERVVIATAGNHDSPDRLMAAAEILRPYGVFIIGRPGDKIPETVFGNYTVYTDENGAVVVDTGTERVVTAALPYVSDKRIGEIIGEAGDDEENAVSYSDKVSELLAKLSEGFSKDTINLVSAHLYTVGGEESGSERSIQLGGSYSVRAEAFPAKAQYIALGHLHRPQTVPGLDKRAFYSGSPLAYSKNEAAYAKAVNMVNVKAGERAQVEKIPLSCIKPIEILKCDSIEEAIEKCRAESGRESYVYLEIKSDRTLSMEEIRAIKALKADIMDIRLILDGAETVLTEEREELSLKDSFIDFYKKSRLAEPDDELVELFMSVMGEGEEG